MRDVLDAAHAVYADAGLVRHARAFSGHGIGIETVESPLLSAASADLELAAGMALCVEPGVAVPGVGGALIEHELIVGHGRTTPAVRHTDPHLNTRSGRYR